MAKCDVCGKFVAAKETASCSKCSHKYHLACAQLKEVPKGNSDWRCHSCLKQSVTQKNKECYDNYGGTPSSSASTTASFEDAPDREVSKIDLAQEMRLFRTELQQMKKELKNELKEIRREVADLRQTVTSCCKRVDSLESRILALENRQEGDISESLPCKFQQTVSQLKSELNDREQELLASDLEIVNLPEANGENAVHTVELVARKLGVTLEARDIVFAERVGIQHNQRRGSGESADNSARARPRRIVVRLVRRSLRDQLLQATRVRRGATSADLGYTAPPRRFFINERLTRTNKQLFYRTRQTAQRLGWRFSWTKGGRILVKQGDGKRTFNIRSEEDLERVFGIDVFKDQEN